MTDLQTTPRQDLSTRMSDPTTETRNAGATLDAPVAGALSAISARNVSAYYGPKRAVTNISMEIRKRSVTALIGPSGCGKSTYIRCFNRMHEFAPNARVEGTILLEGDDIYAPGV